MIENIKSGIYEIRNTVNGKVYVGSSNNIRGRWNMHRYLLRQGSHGNIKLQRSWNKHGEEAFVFSVLEQVDNVDYLLRLEQVWMDWTNCVKEGYNIAPVAGSKLGVACSQETRDKIGDANRGRICTAETRAKMSASSPKIRPPLSEMHKARIASTLTGHIRTQESRSKQSESCKGRTLSTETRAKMSASMMGKNTGPQSEEHKEKVRKTLKGNSRAKGTKRTEEQKRVMSEKSKEAWAKRKAAKLLEESRN